MTENYYGFMHDAVNERFAGGQTYIGDFMVDGQLWAVYRTANPNRELGHKDYLMLCSTHVSGMDEERLQRNRYHGGVRCLECREVLFSYHRHDYKTCPCPNQTMVDGGGAYLRCGGLSLDKVQQVRYDCLERKLV